MTEEHDEFVILRDRLMDVIAEATRDTEWAPPSDDPAVLSEVVVAMGWVGHAPGHSGVSYFRSGSTWSSKGLVRDVLDAMEAADSAEPAEDS